LVAWKTKYNHTSHGHLGIDQSTNHRTTLLEHRGACGLEDEVMEQAHESRRNGHAGCVTGEEGSSGAAAVLRGRRWMRGEAGVPRASGS
jgi:hypothetical protein